MISDGFPAGSGICVIMFACMVQIFQQSYTAEVITRTQVY